MKLINFLNTHDDWQILLTQEPYNLNIQQDGNYYLIKYKKDRYDFSIDIVREARGCIVYYNGAQWVYACRPFDKFCNYGEEYSAVNDIDWNYVSVREKVDGSLIKIWFSPLNNLWMVSTNGTIDADKAKVGDTDISYYEYFIKALGGRKNFQKLLDQLKITCTYMFELVGPENRIVVEYDEPAVYFLRFRENMFGTLGFTTFDIPTIKYPKTYHLRNLDECIAAAAAMSKNEEGFVVCDVNDNMIKVKSPEYLLAARTYNNGILSVKRALEIIQNNMVDDFMGYANQNHQEKMRTIQSHFNYLCYILSHYGRIEKCDNRKDYYFNLSNHINNMVVSDIIKKTILSYGMAYYDDNSLDPHIFLMKNINKLADIIEEMFEAK